MANTTIRIKESGTLYNVPSSLEAGELAINHADGKLYYGNTSNQVTLFDVITEPAGLDGEIQFNNMGSFGTDGDFKYLSSNNTLLIPTINLAGRDVNSTLSSSFNTANAASSYANSSYAQSNTGTILAQAAFDKSNTGSTNSFSTILVSGYSNVVADSPTSNLTIMGQTGIAIGTDVANSIIAIGTNLIGASNVIVDYGIVSEIGIINFDYGYL